MVDSHPPPQNREYAALADDFLEGIRAQSVEMLVPQSVSQSIEVFKISTQFRNWPQKVEELGEEVNHLPQDPNQNDIRMCVQLCGSNRRNS